MMKQMRAAHTAGPRHGMVWIKEYGIVTEGRFKGVWEEAQKNTDGVYILQHKHIQFMYLNKSGKSVIISGSKPAMQMRADSELLYYGLE